MRSPALGGVAWKAGTDQGIHVAVEAEATAAASAGPLTALSDDNPKNKCQRRLGDFEGLAVPVGIVGGGIVGGLQEPE